jgi:hypothetical protein
MATKQDIRNEGFRRGQNVASWTDMPEIGTKLPRDVDWVGIGVVIEANQYEAWEMLCGEAESNDRQFSPFEQTARDLNEMAESKPYDVWEVYEAGIQAGIAAYGRKHHAAALANAKQDN